ncbi:hypothetical protein ACFU6I_04680 [Streptomyces sp. NPDC057486]
MATTARIQRMWPPPATEAHSAVLPVRHDAGIRAAVIAVRATAP